MSEASLAVTFTAREQPRRPLSVDAKVLAVEGRVEGGTREVASVGTPVPGVEVSVRAGDVEVSEGQVGRIHVRGPSLMEGYDGRSDATAEVLRDGWLDTGDLGFVQGGELYVVGRAKDVVILRGANHAPQGFEEALESVPGVRTGCAVALGFLPDGADGEELLLLVEATEEAREDFEERVRGAVLERTSVRPHTVVRLVPGTLPRTSSGKLRRGEALRQFLAGTLAPPGAVNAVTVGTELAKSAVSFLRARLP